MPNLLYYGDNFDVLRASIASESVDLIYLDPPFNSNRAYNVLFKSAGGSESAAQIQAFDDTWRWTQQTDELLDNIVAGGVPSPVANAVVAMRQLLGTSDLMAYLVMMAPRLVELHRVLKATGSLYLHCDPTASHYLKILTDAVFGPEFFKNEIVWKRTNAKGLAFRGLPKDHDIILFYTKSEEFTWNRPFVEHDPEYIRKFYRFTETGTGRRYRLGDLTNPNKNRPNLTYEWNGHTRVWRWTRDRMEEAEKQGILHYSSTGLAAQKRYLDEMDGNAVDDIWTDIPPIQAQAAERLGYPTQKPLGLLERIIAASSNEGDVVLDPFCGCGTTIDAAQQLKRQWVGIDVTYLAIDLIQKRLRHSYGDDAKYTVKGIPTDVEGAAALFAANKFDFERWAVSLIDAQPNEKQVGDKGIDGRVRFHSDEKAIGQVIVSVKGGATINPTMLRDLVGTVHREKAEMGIMLTMSKPTRGIVEEAAKSGIYKSAITGQSYPVVQVVTIAELLAGKRPNMPAAILPYIKASQARGAQLKLI